MDTIETELRKNQINVVCPINNKYVCEIADFVARTLCTSFPELKLNYKAMYDRIVKLPMYIADMPNSASGACYLYMNSSMYFRKGLSLDTVKKLAVHESIHHFQEIKNEKGVLTRLGLCSYVRNKGYGNALNEAAVQLMSAYATREPRDKVTYYGITLPTDSPNYYPLLCNLIKQVGYITGYKDLFESTFYTTNSFFDKFKEKFGEENAFTIQRNFEKILYLQDKIASINAKIQTEDLPYQKFKKCTDSVAKYKDKIQKTFLDTQSLIILAFFDPQLKKLQTKAQIENYRKYLYSFNNLIGTTPSYTFFNDFYIKKMTTLDMMYEKLSGNTNLTLVKQSKLSVIFERIKSLFKTKSKEQATNNNEIS